MADLCAGTGNETKADYKTEIDLTKFEDAWIKDLDERGFSIHLGEYRTIRTILKSFSNFKYYVGMHFFVTNFFKNFHRKIIFFLKK